MNPRKSPAERRVRRPPSKPAGKHRRVKPGKPPPLGANEEGVALIATLHETGQRLEKLTAGEVDTVADRRGRTYLLRRAQDQLRVSDAAKQTAILNALPAHIALLDNQGLIISVNEAWRLFSWADAIQGPGHGIGVNYLEICDHARGAGSSEAHQVADGIRSVLGGRVKRFSIEYPCHSPTEQHWFVLTATPLGDERPNGAVVMHLDVTAEKHAGEELRRSESLKGAILESSLDCLIAMDHEGKIVEFNPAAEATFGLTRKQALGKVMVDLIVPPRLRDAHRRGFAHYLATGKGPNLGKRLELEAIRADGTEFPIELTITAIATSSTPMFTGFVRDITERKRAEEALVVERTLLRTLIDAIPDVVFAKDAAGCFTMCNAAELRHVGKASEEDMIGKSVFDFYPRQLAETFHADDLEALSGKPVLNREEIGMDAAGVQRWYLTTKVPLHDRTGKIVGTVGTSRDITERKQIEGEIHETKTFLASIFDNIPNSIFVKDARDLQFLRVNTACEKLTGYSEKEFLGKSDYDFFPKDQADFFVAKDRETLAGNQQVFVVEETITSKDGSKKLLQTKKFPILAKDGHPQYLLGMSEDITERKHTERRLQESETKYRQLIEQASDGIFITDARGNYQLVNSRACELLGFAESEMIGMHGSLTHLEGDRDTYASRLQAIAGGKVLQYERMMKRKDGSAFPADVSAKRLGDDTVQFIFRDITERRQAEASLRESEGRFRSFAEQSPDAMIIHQAGTIVFVNAAMVRLMRAGDAGTLLGKPGISLLHAGHGDIAEQRRARLYSGQTVPLIDQVYVRSDGTTVEVEAAASPIVLDGKPAALVTVRDITDRRIQEQKISRLSRIHAVMSDINGAIVRIRDRRELFQEACRIIVKQGRFTLGWIAVLDHASGMLTAVAQADLSANAGAGSDLFDGSVPLVPGGTAEIALREKRTAIDNAIENAPGPVPDHEPDTLKVRRAAIALGAKSVIVLPLVVEGETFGILTLYAPERNFFDDEETKLLNDLAGDISFGLEFIAKEEKVDYLAYYDALTGLANRSLFLERLAQYMRSAVSGGYTLALFLIDLERFKNINDSLGRPAGDALLKQVAEWMTRNAGDANLVARVGADHFAAVLPEVKREGDAARVLEKTMAAFMEHPFRLNDAVFRIAHKVGIALFPDDGADADTLFRNAEAALKKAKASGDRYLFYTPTMTATVARTLTLENQLRQALDNEEFVLHYQPKVNLVSGKLTGAEALIRWNDPRTGLVPPGRFIPILEETGLIYEAGRWALRKAIEDHLRWRTAGLAAVRVAVNVSPLQLRNRGFIAEIEQAIGIDPHAAAGLELEITESLIMEDVKHNIASLQAIRAMGVSIAIDDFGTGFSSLAYLSKLPVDTLKIDRSFVTDMTTGPEGLALVSTIINLAHSLKLEVVAEGVETEEQSRLLRLLDCDEMQGYLFSKPVPGEIFETRFLAAPAVA